ncbi:MAG: isoamylase early set domain-containing protein [Gemmatimonadaceae bacterium]
MIDREDVEFAKLITEPLRERESVEPAFEARLLSAVRAAVDRGEAPWTQRPARSRRLGWLTAPRHLAVSPVGGLALAAGFAALVATATLAVSGESRGGIPAGREVVHFAIVAPRAHNVALVGDFNAWDAKTTPMTRGAVDGLWIVTIPLAAGSYQYAFVVDDTTWVADPAAPLALEDEFGTPSSLLTIDGGRT